MPWYCTPPGVRFNDYIFSEPAPLWDWRPPHCDGIAVVLVRNPQWGPKPFQPLYFWQFGGESRLPERLRGEDLMVAVLPMPYASAEQRRSVCRQLTASYISTAELAHKVDELEARQQEQSQQILSLLTYIAKLFEPQPVRPRRPIGFLPDLVPAAAAGE